MILFFIEADGSPSIHSETNFPDQTKFDAESKLIAGSGSHLLDDKEHASQQRGSSKKLMYFGIGSGTLILIFTGAMLTFCKIGAGEVVLPSKKVNAVEVTLANNEADAAEVMLATNKVDVAEVMLANNEVDVAEDNHHCTSVVLVHRHIAEGVLSQLLGIVGEFPDFPQDEMKSYMKDGVWRKAMDLNWKLERGSSAPALAEFVDGIYEETEEAPKWIKLRHQFKLSDTLLDYVWEIVKNIRSYSFQDFIQAEKPCSWEPRFKSGFDLSKSIFGELRTLDPNMHEIFQKEFLDQAKEGKEKELKALLDQFITPDFVHWAFAVEYAYCLMNPFAVEEGNKKCHFHPHRLDDGKIRLTRENIRKRLGIHWPQFDEK